MPDLTQEAREFHIAGPLGLQDVCVVLGVIRSSTPSTTSVPFRPVASPVLSPST